MAYCTIDDLADALRITVTLDNTAFLTLCIDAAAAEIDAALDRTDAMPENAPLAKADNVFRGVQWYKANDVALGGGGNLETGLLSAPEETYVPKSVVPYKENWGVA